MRERGWIDMDVAVRGATVPPSTGPGPVRCSVWWATPRSEARLADELSPGERSRAEGLGREQRARFTTGRSLLRRLLAERVGRPAASLEFDLRCHRCGGLHGKPRLADPAAPVAFSLSSTAGRVAVAITEGAPVGVDVQAVAEVRGPRAATMATDLLTAVERDAWRALPEADRVPALAGWWTRKEAVLKATGEGLAIPPTQLSVTGPPGPPALIAWGRQLRWAGGVAPAVRLHDLSDEVVAASVALLTSEPSSVSVHDGDAVLDR